MTEVLNSTMLPFELAGLLSLYALVGHCCYLGQVWSSKTCYCWKWSKVEADKGNGEWWIAACVAGNWNNTKRDKTFLMAIVLSWNCTRVQQTEPDMAKLRTFSSFCQFVHKSKIIFIVLKRWDALEMCLLNFGSFTFLQLKKVSFKRSTEGAGRKLELVARYEGINKIPCILSIRHLFLLFVCLLCSDVFLFLPLKRWSFSRSHYQSDCMNDFCVVSDDRTQLFLHICVSVLRRSIWALEYLLSCGFKYFLRILNPANNYFLLDQINFNWMFALLYTVCSISKF